MDNMREGKESGERVQRRCLAGVVYPCRSGDRHREAGDGDSTAYGLSVTNIQQRMSSNMPDRTAQEAGRTMQESCRRTLRDRRPDSLHLC